MQRFAVYHFVTLMQDLDKLHEIEELGLEDREDAPPEEPEGGNSSMVPLLQGVNFSSPAFTEIYGVSCL